MGQPDYVTLVIIITVCKIIQKLITKMDFLYQTDKICSYRRGPIDPSPCKQPWGKFRIGIHSKPIRTIPIHSDICIRANANHSEPIRKTFCISFDEEW